MWSQIAANKRRSALILAFVAMLFGIFGLAFGYWCFGYNPDMLIICTVTFMLVYFCIVFITSRNASASSFGRNIQKYDKNINPKLYNIVEEMTVASGLSKIPEIYIMDTNIPNAFACGITPEKASICVTTGLLELLNRDELQGVIAHEISHIVNRDTTYLLYAGAMVTIMGFVSHMFIRSTGSRRGRSSSGSGSSAEAIILLIALIVIILTPIVANLFYMALSRKREYLADACAAQFTRYPAGLADALQKIENFYSKTKEQEKSLLEDNKEKNLLADDPYLKASCIIPAAHSAQFNLFSTHPSTKDRIKILLNMTDASYEAYNNSYSKVTNKKAVIPAREIKPDEKIPIKDAASMVTLAGYGSVGSLNLVPKEDDLPAEELFAREVSRRREVQDMMWLHAEYIFINCECGTILKLPKSYKSKEIVCPHCKKKHIVP